MKQKFTLFFSVALIAILAGCSSLGLTSAKSVDQSLAYAYGVHTAVVTSATQALKSGSLSVSDAQQVSDLAQQARTLLDAARAASGTGDYSTATAKLQLATNILTQLQTYLNSRSAK
jgi:hypothetical protein